MRAGGLIVEIYLDNSEMVDVLKGGSFLKVAANCCGVCMPML